MFGTSLPIKNPIGPSIAFIAILAPPYIFSLNPKPRGGIQLGGSLGKSGIFIFGMPL